MTDERLDAFGRELDALREEVRADLGERDVAHMRRMIRLVRYTGAGGRTLLAVGGGPITFVLGTAALGLSKVLENMEVGHNVMHGQYDWTGDPRLDSRTYEWDIACDGDDWRRSHNVEHHTFTNVLGKDRDIGYGFLRVTGAQPWRPSHRFQPVTAVALALFFQYGVAAHDLRLEERPPLATLRRRARPFLRKLARQLGKDYVLFPALAWWNAPRVLLGNLLANLARNLWSFAIIFCGHFPDGVRVCPERSDESRGAWYLRQLEGSANIEGGRLLHVLSGHLSHQIEHHLYPDLPASRYPELAPRVREICARYGVRYNSGSLGTQLASVARQIVRHSKYAPSLPARAPGL